MPETTITGLPDATTPLDGTERVPMDQAGATKDATTQDIADLAGAAITAAVAAHENAADPHPTYLTAAEGDAAYDALGAAAAAQAAAEGTAGAALTAHEAAPDPHPDYAQESALGTAAALDVGTGPNQVVQLDGTSRLPAVDGSQLTNLPAADATDLSYTAASRLLESSTGADVTLPLADASDAGLMSSSDYVKLLGVESGATGDQTAQEIQVAYESLADRNPFTDAEQTKLAGIEAGAEVNVNADWDAVAGDAVILNKPTLGNAAGLNVGTTAGTVAAGDDARLSDARTPTAHASTHATGQPDALTPADIGAATAAQGALADSATQPGDLGTAAALDVGTGPNQVVQLDGTSRLPAVDGSQLTNLPSGASDLDGLTDVTITTPQNDQFLKYSAGTWINAAAPGGGTVTSVGIVAPTGLTVSGSPVTTSGNITLAYDTGYEGFLSADKTKLDGIEAGATADQTGAEIKAAYEAEANTNAFTDAEQAKLAGVEAGADVTDTANVTAAGALMDSEVTNLAQVKAFNSADYATAAQGALADSATQPGDLPTFPSGAIVGTTDTQTLTNKTLGDLKETVYAIVDAAGVAIDPANGPIQTWTLGDNRTPTSGFTASGQSVLLMIADGTDYAVTWTTVAVTWVGGSAPTLATSGYTVVELWRVGSTIYGAHVGDVA